jgi:hypothetical protein
MRSSRQQHRRGNNQQESILPESRMTAVVNILDASKASTSEADETMHHSCVCLEASNTCLFPAAMPPRRQQPMNHFAGAYNDRSCKR